MKARRVSSIKRSVRHLSPAHIAKTFLTRRAMRRLAEKYGLVYFGRVSDADEDYRQVRGYTMSNTQIDDHYSVGTIGDYDVTLLQRNTLNLLHNGSERRSHWLIVSIQLHTARDLPHVYVGPQGMNDVFEAAYTALKSLPIGSTTTYPQKFSSNFAMYGRQADVVDIERLLPPSAAIVLADHFAAFPFELQGGTLYLYNENRYPTTALAEKMLENGIWLAKNIDVIAGTGHV